MDISWLLQQSKAHFYTPKLRDLQYTSTDISTIFSHSSDMVIRVGNVGLLVGLSVHHFDPDGNISATVWWVAMKFYIHSPQRRNRNDVGDPLTFPLAPQAGQSFYLCCEILQNLLDGLDWYKHSLIPEDESSGDPLTFLWCYHEVDIFHFSGNDLTTIEWIVKFCTRIHGAQTMNPVVDCGVALAFLPASQWGWHLEF